MAIYYSAREQFGKDSDEVEKKWNRYMAWRKLPHLSEVVSLDSSMNKNLIRTESYDLEDWANAVFYEKQITGLFRTLDPVLKKTASQRKFNLLAVEIEPQEACENKVLNEFEFVGYDLMDKHFDVSSLTNCDGFVQSYLPEDVNSAGLITDLENANRIRKRLLENNPEHPHADTIVTAIWRHKTIGR